MKRLVPLLVLVVMLLAGCATGDDAVAQGGTFEFVAPGGKTDITYDPPDDRGKPGPLAGPDLMDTSRTISLQDFAGRVVVINVWGQWCAPCRAEMPQLQQVYDATRDDGVAFLGIDVRDNDIDAPRDFITDRKITFPSIYDPAMRTMIAFGGRYPATVIPSTIVVDREHRVAAVFLRELLVQDLLPVVQRLAADIRVTQDEIHGSEIVQRVSAVIAEVQKLMESGGFNAAFQALEARASEYARLSVVTTVTAFLLASALTGFAAFRMRSDPKPNRHGPPASGEADTFS